MIFLLEKDISEHAPDGETYYTQQAFEPLFRKYKVDLYFCGHNHNYQRMWPIYNSTVTSKNYMYPSATSYIISGAGGQIEGYASVNTSVEWVGYAKETWVPSFLHFKSFFLF